MNEPLSHAFARRFDVSAIRPPKDFVPLSKKIVSHPHLVLEIGAGRGKHAHDYALANPSHHLIAIERTRNKAVDLLSCQLPNLTALHTDAIFWSVYGLPPACLQAVYILYPNPEPANTNQRFVNMPYFEFLLSRLKAGGQMTIASNIGAYLDEMSDKLSQVWRLPFEMSDVAPTSARTHFEIKYLARGETCRQIVLTKPCGYVTAFDEMDLTDE